MLFELKNIGAIKHANIELGKLTVLCGKNNTGKTYINYSIYGIFAFFPVLLEKVNPFPSLNQEQLKIEWDNQGIVQVDLNSVETDLADTLTSWNRRYTDHLKEVFSANADEFAAAEFKISLPWPLDYSDPYEWHDSNFYLFKEPYSSILVITRQSSADQQIAIANTLSPLLLKFFLRKLDHHFFIQAAERTAIQLFQNELDKHKSKLVKELTNIRDLAQLEEEVARFALPIKENINFTRDSDLVIKSNSFLTAEQPELTTYLEDMLGVQYAIINGRKVVIDKATDKVLPLYLASTSVRTLFDLHLWLKHRARKGDILFIDEPELHLHPENQMKMARLLVRLVNRGVDVFVTTHSTYLVKEFNNLLMLANDLPDKEAMMTELGYTQDDILRPEDLRAYITHLDGTVSQVDVDAYGMVQSGFDDAIVQINENSNKLITTVDNL
jgi:predicted ATP-binding protein involved in virulence